MSAPHPASEALTARVGRVYPDKALVSHAELLALVAVLDAAYDYTLNRGWAVLGDELRCADCNARIDDEHHADGCRYDRLVAAVELLQDRDGVPF